MPDSVTASLLRYFQYEQDRLYILADEAYASLARNVQRHHGHAEFRPLTSGIADTTLTLPAGAAALLLAEPESYVRLRLYKHLDFSQGEPQLPGIRSKVLIFPRESLHRLFSEMDGSLQEKARLYSSLLPHRRYRITTAAGTNLVFAAREWIPLDFEVCTTPVEQSVSGVIVVDGALFFRSIAGRLHFVIQEGKLASITADTPESQALTTEYQRMTESAMTDPINRQLAEIGVDFCRGAIISDCFMEAEAAADTCHFCFDNNACYGGKNTSGFHGASVLIRNPIFTPLD